MIPNVGHANAPAPGCKSDKCKFDDYMAVGANSIIKYFGGTRCKFYKTVLALLRPPAGADSTPNWLPRVFWRLGANSRDMRLDACRI
ncbi:hypothetical protein IW18_203 [Vibrio phage IW18]|nr:hypothetical protein IW18_1 [Vibrio phage IW18]WBF69552.1 hypothetical protein IW18_203 [Vibrio phage IW18]